MGFLAKRHSSVSRCCPVINFNLLLLVGGKHTRQQRKLANTGWMVLSTIADHQVAQDLYTGRVFLNTVWNMQILLDQLLIKHQEMYK